MTTKRQALIEQFLASARSLGRAVWAGREQCFMKFKLHPAQVRLLYFVKREGSVTVKDIAEALGTSSSATTQMIEGIARSGYVKRVADLKDRRKVHIILSSKGRRQFEKFRRSHLAWTGKLLAPLSDRELEQLIAIQRKVMVCAEPCA